MNISKKFTKFSLIVQIFRRGVRAIQMANMFARKKSKVASEIDDDIAGWQNVYLRGKTLGNNDSNMKSCF